MPWLLSANLSMLFTHLPMLERVRTAGQAGFEGVEIQFPYAVPPQVLRAALDDARMPLALFNVPAGDLLEGGAGLAGVPGREVHFDRALRDALAYARIARPQRVNVLPGRLLEGTSREAALDTLADNLAAAASAFAELGVGVVCEAINRIDMPGFLLATASELSAMLERVDHPNLSAQLDFYHMQQMGEPLPWAIAHLGERIGHVQFADSPGRGAPGTGSIDFAAAFAALEASNYRGWVGAEYRQPEGADDLLWLDRWRGAGYVRRLARNG